MFAHLTPRQRLGYAAIGGLFLVGMGFIGAQKVREPAPIVFERFQEVGGGTRSAGLLSNPGESGSQVVVHVVGEVKSPGLLRLPPGARIADAVERAGGPTGAANLEALNLAQKLQDGAQLRVPARGEPLSAAAIELPLAPAPAPKAARESEPYVPPLRDEGPLSGMTYLMPERETRSTSKASAGPPAGGVNVNSATLEELDALPGVGPVTAQRIIEHREMSGGFRTIDELLAVKGIGPKKLEQMRPFVRL